MRQVVARFLRPGLDPQNVFACSRKIELPAQHSGVAGERLARKTGSCIYRGLISHRAIGDLLGGIQEFFEEQRRNGQHVAKIVESIPGLVRRKIIGGMEIDPQQVPHGVVVFHLVQPPYFHPARVGRLVAIAIEQLMAEPLHRLRPVLRQEAHRRRAEAWRDLQQLQRLGPDMAVSLQCLDVAILIESEIALVRTVSVAIDAVLLEKRQEACFVISRQLGAGRCGILNRGRIGGRILDGRAASRLGFFRFNCTRTQRRNDLHARQQADDGRHDGDESRPKYPAGRASG